MTVLEIRNQIAMMKSSVFSLDDAQVGALWQIAQQLAELNEWLRKQGQVKGAGE